MKEEKQQPKKEKPEQKNKASLAQVPEKYQSVCNLQYVRDDKARKQMMEIIDELRTIDDLVLEKTGNHDLSVRFKGRQMVKICPLKKDWSASIQGGKIQRYTKEQILENVRDAMKDASPSNSNDGKDVIKQLKDRVGKMSGQRISSFICIFS
ncbi:MAG: hypothetical protein U9R21_08720 [Candidatus Thermoplasmatota archaeon]|nr:hypothetical protein [Candidatus Thermoplasmatota archaeon]